MKNYTGRKLSGWIKALIALILVGVLGFSALEGVILVNGRTQISGEPDIMIILGCQVKSYGPSQTLQDRLDTALEYLKDHPDMTVVVSGGQGPDEPTSEAQCMFDYLAAAGFPAEQIIQEDASHNTAQNLRYTRALLDELGYDIQGSFLVVSSNFHLARVKLLWGDLGELSVLAAPVSHAPTAVKMFFREPLALVKSFFFD